MISVPNYIEKLAPYVPGKPIEETQREYQLKKVIKLASNENPLGPSPRAIRAIQSVHTELHRYPDSSAFSLKTALAKKEQVQSGQIILGNGSNEVIDQIIRTYCVPGDAIATYQYSFIAYRICAQIHGVHTLEAGVDAQLSMSVDELVDLVRKNERVKVVFVAQPNNPTGQYLKKLEFEKLLKDLSLIRGGSVLIVIDHAYAEYVSAPDFVNPQSYLSTYPQLMILKTFSKVYGLAGLRVGYGVASADIIVQMEKVRQPFNINSLGMLAAEQALEDFEFVQKSVKMNALGMKFWEEKLTELEISFWKSQGNFLLAQFSKELGVLGFDVYQKCLQQGLILRPVHNYGLPHALRITIGTAEENEWAVEKFAAVCKDLRK